MKIDTGISDTDRAAIAQGLSRLLAESLFNTLHLMFERQYAELATAADEIAEWFRAPATRHQTLTLNSHN